MKDELKIRDPVHNFIHLSDEEGRLINTPVFQRLRRIHQLAMAYLVYPGALHTRFDHSLGVCHVAKLMAEQLGIAQNDDDARLVRLAALLHDLGHGPFSHVSENALEIFADRSKLSPGQKKEKIHEVVTGHIIRHDPEIADILDPETRNKVADLLAEGRERPELRAIVSGPLDADKQDYLLRDSYFCGVSYGHFDIHQFLRSLVMTEDATYPEILVKRSGLHAVEQFVMAKYYLTANVYRHKVRLITDQMLTRAISLGIEEDGLKDLERIYKFDNSEAFFSNYRQWDDSKFLCNFSGTPESGKFCHQLIDRLNKRRLFKRAYSEHMKEFKDPNIRKFLSRICKPDNRQARERIEEEVAKIISSCLQTNIDKKLVILNVFDIKSVRSSSRNDEGGIMIETDHEPMQFEEESDLFRSINEGYSTSFVEIYGPLGWTSDFERDDQRKKVVGPIRDAIKENSRSLIRSREQ